MWAGGECTEGALIGEKKGTVVPSRWLTHDFAGPPPFLVAGVGRVNPIFLDESCTAPESPGRSSGYESSGCCEDVRWARELSPIPEGVAARRERRPSPSSTVSSGSGLLAVHCGDAKRESSAASSVSSGFSVPPQRRKLLSSSSPICAQDVLQKLRGLDRRGAESAGLPSFQEVKCPPQPLDFTLDIPRAERLMRQIEASKRRRCCGRALTAALALVFFLLTVVAVSLLYTRGKKFFGPL